MRKGPLNFNHHLLQPLLLHPHVRVGETAEKHDSEKNLGYLTDRKCLIKADSKKKNRGGDTYMSAGRVTHLNLDLCVHLACLLFGPPVLPFID